jgi:tRNA(fMet)-specific endonuclease VapC
MSVVVVDTDVISFVFKEDTRAATYQPHLVGRTAVISFMTVAELDRWALARRWGEARRARLRHLLRQFAVCYANRDLCRHWAEATESARCAGRPIACADAWTAAVALLFDAPLVTHNPTDYRGVGGLQIAGETGTT